MALTNTSDSPVVIKLYPADAEPEFSRRQLEYFSRERFEYALDVLPPLLLISAIIIATNSFCDNFLPATTTYFLYGITVALWGAGALLCFLQVAHLDRFDGFRTALEPSRSIEV